MKLIRNLIGLVALVPTLLAAKSQLDIGVGLGYTQIPHYVGAAQQHQYLVPYPYVYYKSDKIEFNRNALNASLWQHENWLVDWSASGSLALDSDDNQLRKGMDDLAWVLEFGPALRYFWLGDKESDDSFSAIFAIRHGIGFDKLNLEHVGFLFEPGLRYQSLYQLSDWQLKLTASWQLVYADRNYNSYYYSVPVEQVTTTRHFYQAGAGLNSHRLSLGLTASHGHWWYGAFFRYNDLTNASVKNSPLVAKKRDWMLGIAITRIFNVF
ncbi:putative outer membrane protein [Catenovulum agarivorans DS-2]|uniref:Putative outer membrane protein n=1 Tax=Catenovulum agarivorans DS-2 TaxID=1328313 RepID=W7QCJ2_9ALTE|nr:MipA/OmpV family protein [Catenovulum agarivorans]EWH10604.1 putative outer membrane protein [Catenovulum agarivorans DS-2]